MNKQRRLQLTEAQYKIDEAKEAIEILLAEEEEYLENMPDSLKDGEKGERAQSAIDSMEAAISSLEEAMSHCEEAAE